MSIVSSNFQVAWYRSLNWFELRNSNADVFCKYQNTWHRCQIIAEDKNWRCVRLKTNSTSVRIQDRSFILNTDLSVNFDLKTL